MGFNRKRRYMQGRWDDITENWPLGSFLSLRDGDDFGMKEWDCRKRMFQGQEQKSGNVLVFNKLWSVQFNLECIRRLWEVKSKDWIRSQMIRDWNSSLSLNSSLQLGICSMLTKLINSFFMNTAICNQGYWI